MKKGGLVDFDLSGVPRRFPGPLPRRHDRQSPCGRTGRGQVDGGARSEKWMFFFTFLRCGAEGMNEVLQRVWECCVDVLHVCVDIEVADVGDGVADGVIEVVDDVILRADARCRRPPDLGLMVWRFGGWFGGLAL